MSNVVADPLYIKTIEKTIGRKLTEEEMERVRFGEVLFVEKRNGYKMSIKVPLYRMPDDLTSEAVDVRQICEASENGKFFDYIFNKEEVSELPASEGKYEH